MDANDRQWPVLEHGEDPLPDTVERTTYRVLQEALTNVSRHAEASTVSVIVERERDSLRMIIEDDGRGFDAEAHSDGARPARYGIIGIRERLALVGGTLNIESAVGDGTAIYVRIPLPAGDPG